MTRMPWAQTQDCNGCMQTPPLLCLSGWIWLILLASADRLVRPWVQKLALALRGLGQQLLWSQSSMTVLFWSKSNQAAHTVLWAVYQLSSGWFWGGGWADGHLIVQCVSMAKTGSGASGNSWAAPAEEFDIWIIPAWEGERLLGGSLRTCQTQHGDSRGKTRPPPIVRPPGTTEALQGGRKGKFLGPWLCLL